MTRLKQLSEDLLQLFPNQELTESLDELTLELPAAELKQAAVLLRDRLQFEQLIDVCGVDYLDYGVSEWNTQQATGSGFSRAVDNTRSLRVTPWNKPRFAVVYHLLSVQKNYRLRLKVFAIGEPPCVPSVLSIWPAANWYEREAFDLYGILFEGHPDLRRLLTDYGFIGHPFRKDFPMSGEVGVRYDAEQKRVVYEPIDITPRILEPKVIRQGGFFEEIKPEVEHPPL